MDLDSAPSGIPLGDGLTTFALADGSCFRIDLMAWTEWYIDAFKAEKGDPFKLAVLAQAKVKADCGIDVNRTLADALLHQINMSYMDLKKKQGEEQRSFTSTE